LSYAENVLALIRSAPTNKTNVGGSFWDPAPALPASPRLHQAIKRANQ